MSVITARRVAITLWGLSLVMAAAAVVLGALTVDADLPADREDFVVLIALMSAMVVVYGGVGAIVAARRPGNAIGWLLCGVAVCLATVSLAYGYADYALYDDGDGLPLATFAAWATNSLFILPVFIAPCFLLLLFPDGRLPSRRWRPVAWLGVVVAFVAVVGSSFDDPLPSYPDTANPITVGGTAREVLDVADVVGETVLAPLIFVLSLAALIVRFRRSRGVERQQLKWLAYAATVMVVNFALTFLVGDFVPAWVSDVLFLTAFAGFGLLPVAAGVAILRHRLYDVDVVINRTLVYGALTATLLASYLGSVLLLQLALGPLTEDNDLAIAGSTLAAAALFRPARARIQALVDRRFYRSRYDAGQILGGFGARLRDEVDLDSLSRELRAAASTTMQPAHVSLWLRAPGDGAR